MLFKTSNVRGIRNNNPGNIRGASYTWKGETGRDDKDFVIFNSPEMGIRAMYRTLLTYRHKHGLTTVRGIINRWAPPNENLTGSYVNHVANRLGKSPDTPLELADYPALITAIIRHENGVQPYDRTTIERGIALA